MSLRERTFHVIPFFHYDVAYLHTRTEYLAQAFHILDAAMRVLSADTEATYLVESPYLLQEWFSARPEARAAMRRFSQEERLDISPGLYVMPDVAIPGAESLDLQAELGFQWCEEELGVRPTVCWMPGSGNHPATLPQWLRRCGYEAYIFARGADAGHPNHFRWRGLDGSETLGVRMPLSYDTFPPIGAIVENAEAVFLEYLNQLDALFPPGQPVLVPLGADFAAPAPQVTQLLALTRKRGIQVGYSTLPRFVTALRAHWSELPVMPSDFAPSFQGAFSSRISLKQSNRQAETLVDALRRLEAAGGKPVGNWRASLPALLRQQAHGSISGALVDAAAEDSAADYSTVLKGLRAGLPKTRSASTRTIFNPSAETRTDCVFLKGWIAPGAADETGASVPIQRLEGGAVARVTVPGLRSITLSPVATEEPFEDAATATRRELATSLIRVLLDENGNITQLVLKGRGADTRLLSGDRPFFNTLSLEHDYGDFWGVHQQPLDGDHVHRTPYPDPLPLEKDAARPWVNSAGVFSDEVPKRVEVLESGPLRARVRMIGSLVLYRWRVDFEQTITVHAGSPRVDFRTVLKPAAKFARVRAVFRPGLGHAEALYHVPFGVVGRDPSEHAAQNGVALNGAHASMLLLNKGIPGNGWDGEALTLSLLRCVAMEYLGPSETGYEADTTHVYEYAVVPYRPSNRPDLCREGDRFNLPMMVVPDPVPGLPFTLLHADNVQITRVEKVPGGFRLHGHESLGKEAYLRIEVQGGWAGPVDVTGQLMEEPVADVFDRGIRPYEIFMLGIVYGEV